MLVAGSCTSDVDWSGSTDSGATSAADGSETEPSPGSATCASTPDEASGEAATVLEVAEAAMQEDDLRGVLVSVGRGDQEIVTAALGESVDGVPLSTDLRFFDGAVVFTHLGTLMLLLDRDGVLDMDAPIDEHLDGVPGGDRITPRMLMSSTSGLVDYVPMEEFVDQLYADPFRPFTTPELDALVYAEPLLFEPGADVSYTHQGFRLAGAVMEAASGERLDDLLAERITEPLGMTSTEVVESVDVPGPVLRTFTDERGQYEESTSWSPAWGVPERAMQVMDICDLRRSAHGIGSGELLQPGELQQLTARSDIAPDAPSDDCPSCIPQSDELYLGLGVTVAGDWIIQTPSFTGFAAVQAYLPSEGLSIAVANNLGPDGDVGTNASTAILAELARQLTPESPLPARMG